MQVSFNPYSNQRCKPNFKALSTAQIAEATKGFGQANHLKTDVVIGAIKLEQVDIDKFKELIPALINDGKKFVAGILDEMVKNYKP